MKKILIIDDNIEFIECFKFILMQNGYGVDYINKDFNESLEIIKKIKPDCILMDIQLESQINGLDLTKMIKEDIETLKIPVIALTGIKDEKINTITNYCDGYITKGASQEDLLAMIKLYLD